jgi:drug/metabolite transporter (DMT)-like permease
MRLSQLDGLNMLLWRGGLSGLAYFMIWFWMRGPRDLSNIWTRNFAIIVACQTGNAALFSLAIAIAPVTVVLIGVATVPIFAAILSRFMLGEALSMRTLVTATLVFLGLFICVLGSEDGQVKLDLITLIGAGLGLGVAFSLAMNFTVIRKDKEVPFVLAIAVGAIAAAGLGSLFLHHNRMAASPTDGRDCFNRNFHPPAVFCDPLLCGPLCPLLHREPHHVAGNSFGPFMGLVGH